MQTIDLVASTNALFRTIARINPETVCPECKVTMKLIDNHGIETEFSQISGPVYKTIWELYECPCCGDKKEINF
jgi:uncharacterized protein with PIN domain